MTRRVRLAFASLVFVVGMAPMFALATPYGCGSYGNSTYNDSCPATTTTTTTKTTASDAGSTEEVATPTSETVTDTTTNTNKTTTKSPVSAPAVTTPKDSDFLRVFFSPITISILLALLVIIIVVAKRVAHRDNRI